MNIVDEQLLAYNDRDLERFIAAYSPDVVIEDGESNLFMQGYDQMRERYGTLFDSNPKLHAQILSRMQLGKYTVDEEQITGISSSPTPLRAIAIYRVEEGKIVHVRFLR